MVVYGILHLLTNRCIVLIIRYYIYSKPDKTQIFMQLWVSCESNHQVYFYIKINKNIFKSLKYKYKITNAYKTKVHCFFFTCFNKNLFKCLQLLISFDFLFNTLLSLMWLIIQNFSVKHNLHIAELALPQTLWTTFHWIFYLTLFFKFQMYFVNYVLYWYLVCLTSCLWLL